MTRKRPKPRRFLVRYTLQGAAMTWGPFEADDAAEATDTAEKVMRATGVGWKVEEVKS